MTSQYGSIGSLGRCPWLRIVLALSLLVAVLSGGYCLAATDADAKKTRLIVFPADCTFGRLFIRPYAGARPKYFGKAKGTVRLPAGAWVVLRTALIIPERFATIRTLHSNDLQEIDLSDSNVTDNDLESLRALTGLNALSLGRTYISDNGLKPLSLLHNLQTLDLSASRIKGLGFRHIGLLKSLRTVELDQCSILTFAELQCPQLQRLTARNAHLSDRVLSSLPKQPQLTDLCLNNNPELDDSAFKYLRNCPALANLELADTGVTGKQIANLSGLPIVVLTLDNCPISSRSFKSIAKLDQLGDLSVSNIGLTAANLEMLAGSRIYRLNIGANELKERDLLSLTRGFSELQALDLQDNPLTDSALPILTRLICLTELKLDGTKISPKGIHEIQRQLPRCTVRHTQADAKYNDLVLQLANLYKQKKFVRAADLLTSEIAKRGTSLGALDYLICLQAAAGRYLDCLKLMSTYMTMAKQQPYNSRVTTTLREVFWCLQRAHRLKESLEVARSMVDYERMKGGQLLDRALLCLGETLLYSYNPEAVERYVEALAWQQKYHPYHYQEESWLRLGLAYSLSRLKHDDAAALQQYVAVTRLPHIGRDEQYNACAGAGILYCQFHKFDLARPLLERARRIFPISAPGDTTKPVDDAWQAVCKATKPKHKP